MTERASHSAPSSILVVDDDVAIRSMVAAILERQGYVTHTAEDGDAALASLAGAAEGARVVLVDFAMPRMDGLLFCRELHKRFPQRKLGVILMSGRADRLQESFVLHAGALDAISKPFEPEALLVVVENVLRRVREDAPPPSSKLLEPEDDERGDRSPDSAPPPNGGALPPGSEPPAVDDHLVLSGDLAHLPIGAVLQLLQMESQTGALVVEGDGRTIIVTLRGGLIDFAQSRRVGDEFRLGRYFVEAGLVTPRELEELHASLAAQRASGDEGARATLLGDWLVARGKLSPIDLAEALQRQTSELVYEVLRWQKGHFEFRKRPPSPEAAACHLGLHAAQVVLEGFRRVDEWRVIEARVGHFDQVLVRDDVSIEEVDARRMDKSELAVLEAVDGHRSIREIIAASHRSSFEACRILFQLLEARLVRRRHAP